MNLELITDLELVGAFVVMKEIAMEPYQLRVVEEEKELSEKLKKLSVFLGSDVFKTLRAKEQNRLHMQFGHMGQYRNILKERIYYFSHPE